MFRFREVERNIDRINEEEEDRKRNGYLKIKPKTDITTEESVDFINNLFRSMSED